MAGMTKDEELERARQAAGLLQNPLMIEAFAVLKEGYTQGLMACALNDDKGRAAYALALRGLATIQNHLGAVLMRGQIGQQKIQDIEEAGVFKTALRSFY